MRKSITARRGTSIAAAALSFALVAPLAQPVAFAQDNPPASAAPASSADKGAQQGEGKNKQVPNAIFTKGGWRDFYGYHGWAYINKDGRHDDLSSNNEPLKGNVIYLQYVTKNGEVSPTFYTTTDSEGRFSFDLSENVTNEVDAPPFWLAAGGVRVRVWGENPDPSKYSVVAAGDFNSGRYTSITDRVQESWNFTAGPAGSRITNGRFVLEEKPNHVGWLAKPEKDWTRALDGETGEPTVDGQFPYYGDFGAIKSIAHPNESMVWWETGESAGTLPGYYKYQPSRGDRVAGGIEIVASYLNDEVARQIDAWKNENPNYTVEQERANQERIIKAYQDEHGEGSHIAETVVAPSKDDGTIYLPFKGTLGYSRDKANFGVNNVVSDEDWGKVADDYQNQWVNVFTGASLYDVRHINTDYMYIYPNIDGRDVKNSAFVANMFMNYGDQGTVIAGANMNGLQFPLMTAQPIFDIPEYNSYDNKGRPGSKVTTKTSGLLPNTEYAIRWYATAPDGTQTEIKDAMCKIKSDDKGALESCDFQAPEDLKETTVYTAALVSVDPASGEPSDRWEIADSFTAVVPEPLPLGSVGTDFPDNDVTPLFKDLPDNMKEGAEPSYSANDLPAGLEIDPKTGKITGKPTTPGTTEVIVTREVEVMVEQEVPVLDDDGNPVYKNPDEEDPEKRVEKTEKKPVAQKRKEQVVTKITVTDTKLSDGVVGEPYEQEVKPEGFDKLPQGFELKKDSIKVEGLPEGLEPKNGKIIGTPKKTVDASEEKPNVTVTYTLVDQDGNETEHTDVVPLKVTDQAGKYDPEGKDQEVAKNSEPKAEDSIANKDELPEGTKYAWKDAPKTDTSGDKKAVVVVTYPDGTTDEVPVTVKVAKDQAEQFDPEGKDQEVAKNSEPKAEDSIANKDKLPEGTKYTWKDAPKTDTSGDKPAVVVVTYPDGTTDEVPVTVKVAKDQAEQFDPQGKDQTVETGKKPEPKNNVEDADKLPKGTTFKYKEDPDTSTAGDKPVTVIVTYPDGSTDEVEAKVVVQDKVTQADQHNPQGKDQTVETGKKPEPKDNVKDADKLPKGTTFAYKKEPDTSTAGDKPVTVIVTYPDGSTDEVQATVKVEDPKTEDPKPQPEQPKKSDADTYEPQVQDKTVAPNEVPEAKDHVTNVDELPEGTTFEYEQVPDTSTEGDKPVTIVVTYPDGTTDKVNANVKVQKNATDADKNDPQGQDQKVEKGGTPDAKGNIKDADSLPKGTSFKYKETPDTSKPGVYDVTVVVTYPDGSTDEVQTTVTVGTDAERFVPEYDKVTGVPVDGEKNTNDPFGTKAPVKSAEAKKPEGAEKWAFTPQENGVLKAKAPSMKDVSDEFKAKLPELKSTDVEKRWDKFFETFTPFARPAVEVDFTYEDDSTNSATANFDLIGKDGKSLLDPNGDFDGDGVTNEAEVKAGSDPANDGEKPDTTAPTVNPITAGDTKISGKGDRPNETIIVTLPNGKELEATTDANGNWSVNLPKGVELKQGDKVNVRDGHGNKAKTVTVAGKVNAGACAATAVGFGLPLIALLPLGLASQIQIPVLSDLAGQVEAQLQAANTRIQQQAGIFNPEMARQAERINAQLRTVGADLGMVVAGIALIAAGVLAGTFIYDACKPGGPSSSVKDLELKGSSGKTTKLSSESTTKDGKLTK
ncbi:putative Ig domain-containing protein [Corynebacterium sp. CCUG 61414]|uniref:Rib/alpha-like domain-containing protein n=1 Tax=Corynebacterium sp. CCUG 61414 TaxID=2823896 RepID=UPI00210EC21D|nr:Rib/alpha-like domain-containing protein [Corynebacterium sp. CCUG 61414]MCQ4609738.1 putative Ig domain-containing protein [Corynebacterium sp. CCUG 61414]